MKASIGRLGLVVVPTAPPAFERRQDRDFVAGLNDSDVELHAVRVSGMRVRNTLTKNSLLPAIVLTVPPNPTNNPDE